MNHPDATRESAAGSGPRAAGVGENASLTLHVERVVLYGFAVLDREAFGRALAASLELNLRESRPELAAALVDGAWVDRIAAHAPDAAAGGHALGTNIGTSVAQGIAAWARR
jgi:hypothetical protein